MHHVIKVVFRTIKQGDWKGALDCVYADVRNDGMYTVNDGGSYNNDWYLQRTRPATPEEYALELDAMNKHGKMKFAHTDDTYEFIPVRKRTW